MDGGKEALPRLCETNCYKEKMTMKRLKYLRKRMKQVLDFLFKSQKMYALYIFVLEISAIFKQLINQIPWF